MGDDPHQCARQTLGQQGEAQIYCIIIQIAYQEVVHGLVGLLEVLSPIILFLLLPFFAYLFN